MLSAFYGNQSAKDGDVKQKMEKKKDKTLVPRPSPQIV